LALPIVDALIRLPFSELHLISETVAYLLAAKSNIHDVALDGPPVLNLIIPVEKEG